MTLETRFGLIWATINDDGALVALGFGEPTGRARGSSPALEQQLREYCDGTRTEFDLDLAPQGTPFQKSVWQELCRIPAGTTITYRQLAERLGLPAAAARAVGRANATNPIALAVPCHRVIGSDGSLTGYAYGTELKQRLLEWEGFRIKASCTNP